MTEKTGSEPGVHTRGPPGCPPGLTDTCRRPLATETPRNTYFLRVQKWGHRGPTTGRPVKNRLHDTRVTTFLHVCNRTIHAKMSRVHGLTPGVHTRAPAGCPTCHRPVTRDPTRQEMPRNTYFLRVQNGGHRGPTTGRPVKNRLHDTRVTTFLHVCNRTIHVKMS